MKHIHKLPYILIALLIAACASSNNQMNAVAADAKATAQAMTQKAPTESPTVATPCTDSILGVDMTIPWGDQQLTLFPGANGDTIATLSCTVAGGNITSTSLADATTELVDKAKSACASGNDIEVVDDITVVCSSLP